MPSLDMSQYDSIFLANRKNDEDVLTDAQKAWLLHACRAKKVTTARDDHAKRFLSMGGWRQWTESVGVGCEYGSTRQRFDCFVVPGAVVGKATYDILENADRKDKPIYILELAEDATVEQGQSWNIRPAKGVVLLEGKTFVAWAELE